MNTDNREALLAELRSARDRQGQVSGILTLECSHTSCPVQVVTLRVRERLDGRLLQPPMKCCRCGNELVFIALE
jgi:hypothetical protein